MKRIGLVAALAALQIMGTGCQAMAKPAPGDIVIEAMLATAIDGERDRVPEQVFLSLEPALEPELFDQLSPGKKLLVAQMYARAAHQLQQWDKAHAAYVKATAQKAAAPEDWDGRLHTAILSGDGPDTYLAFRHLRDAGYDVLSTFAGRDIDGLDQMLRSLPDREAHQALGREMAREDWQPPYAYDDPSNLWLHYVEAQLEAGDVRGAAVTGRRITNPMIIMAMQADRRFDAVIAANPTLQDAHGAAERYLAWARERAAAEPQMVGGQIAVVRALSILNRPAEALPILEEASTVMATASRTRPPFDDMELRPAVEAWRSSILLSLGRFDEGIGARSSEAACECSPTAALRVAHPLMEAGRAQEAQRWLRRSPTEGLSLQDRMELSQTTACVAVQLSDEKGLARELAYLGAHEAWMPEALADALVCAGRLDEAEAVLRRQLADPRTRLAALTRLQTYATEAATPKFRRDLDARWASLAARPSLQAEVAKVGRLNRFDLTQWESVS